MAKSRRTPSARSKELLTEVGYLVDTVERWVPIKTMPGGGIRKDLLHIIDLVAISDDETVGVQCCGSTGMTDHLRKILGKYLDNTTRWVKHGLRRLLIHAWKKRPKCKSRPKDIWELTEYEITEKDLEVLSQVGVEALIKLKLVEEKSK